MVIVNIVVEIIVVVSNDQEIHQDNLREQDTTARRLIDEAREGNTLVAILAD